MVQPEEYTPPTINGTSHDVLHVDLYVENAFTRSSHTLEFPPGQIHRGWVRVKDVQAKIGQMLGLTEADVRRVELKMGETTIGDDEDARLSWFRIESGSEIEAWTPAAVESRGRNEGQGS